MDGSGQRVWTHTKLSVGAGSQVSMKSAMMAITTLAPTKSISFQKLSSRLAFSAVTLVTTPMPHSMATLTGNEGSPSRRSRKPTRNGGGPEIDAQPWRLLVSLVALSLHVAAWRKCVCVG